MSTNPRSRVLTFLFTDLKDSTRLWEEFPKSMQSALPRHDALLRQAVENHRGHLVKTTGDGLHAVFGSASDAIAAAIAGQRVMGEEDWPDETGPLEVRMGLHTGESQERGGDYYGPEVNRAARVMSSGHGGQILLTEASALLLRSSLPPEVSLVDLGEYRLKGFASPVRIYQASYPGIPADFPPPKAAPRHVANLPVQPNELIGRQNEIAEATALLRRKDVRLLTLTGPGGTGKTRLGLQLAENIKDEYEDGVFFVPLAEIRDPELLPSTIAKTWSIRVSDERPLLEKVKAYLQNRSLLLVLDNFEQILEAGPVVADMLSASPRLNVLVTSRETLRVSGEYNYPVPPLKLPDSGDLPPLDRLVQFEAVRLFVERAQAVKNDFTLTKDNAMAVAEICRRLDGLPLAIELAAARTRLLPPRKLLAHMENRIPFLVGGARDLPQRQQTLHHTISWSHDLLGDSEKILFRRFSVFSSAPLEAIEEVRISDSVPSDSFYTDLESLVDKSLINQESTSGEARFEMLETIREYALIKLEEAGEMEEIRNRQLDFYLKLSQEANTGMMGSDQAHWLARMERERANLRWVLNWGLGTAERTEVGVKVISALINLLTIWQIRGDHEEWSYLFDLALDKSVNAPLSVRAQLLEGMGNQALLKGQYKQAGDLFDQSSTLYQEAGDTRSMGFLMVHQAHAALGLKDFDGARQFAEIGLELYPEDNDWRTAAALLALGDAAFLQSRYDDAQRNYEESLSIVENWESAIPIGRRNIRLGQVSVKLENTRGVHTHFHKGLTLAAEENDHLAVATALGGLANREMVENRPEKAARLLGAARSRLDSYGIRFFPMDEFMYNQTAEVVRNVLGEELFTAIRDEGRTMVSEEAVAYALETLTT